MDQKFKFNLKTYFSPWQSNCIVGLDSCININRKSGNTTKKKSERMKVHNFVYFINIIN